MKSLLPQIGSDLSSRKRLMDGGQLQSSSKIPVWIIEHVWAHRMMDIQGAVEPSSWPDVDSQPLSLEDSWRLRVISAQVYSIVKSRDMKNFERVLGFLDTTHRLLPSLVPAIKHMKIMFGLKTMVIMWMLKEDKGVIDIVSKIGQFFPNKLPQYQDQCNQRQMFLMRKNHLDFKSLAQTLAINRDRLEDYMKNQMEERYGERYAQKVEDRLLLYLRELETALPGDTYIDKILKKQSPVTTEEKLLLEVITSDSMTIVTTLRKLLHCDVATCRPTRMSQSPVGEKKGVETSQLTKWKDEGENIGLKFHSDVFTGGEEASQDVAEASPLLLENESSSDVREHQLPVEADEAGKMMDDGRNDKKEDDCSQRSSECGKETSSSPQFCSKHQRWVKNILQGCPDDCSEELLHQINASSSPVLLQSSSSTSSSQDATPSGLIPSPTDQPPSQTSEAANTRDKTNSTSPKTIGDTSQTEALPQSTSLKNAPLPPLLSPVVRLVDIASSWRSHSTSRTQQVTHNHLTVFISKQQTSSSSPLTSSLCRASGNADSNMQTASGNQNVSTRCRRQPSTQQTFSKLSLKFRHACSTTRHAQASARTSPAERCVKYPGFPPASSQPLSHDTNVSKPLVQNAPTSAPHLEMKSSVCAAKRVSSSARSSQQLVHQNSIKPHTETHNTNAFQSKSLSCRSVNSSSSNLLQPYVKLTRLSIQECQQGTGGRASARQEEPTEQGSSSDETMTEMEGSTNSSFDVNSLYSSSSPSSEDSLHCDPDYRPHINKKRLVLEFESARILNHT